MDIIITELFNCKKLLLEAMRLVPEGVFDLQFKSSLSHKVEEIFTPDANSGNFRFTAGSRNRTVSR